MVRPDLNATAEARVKGLVGLRDCVQELIDLQMDAAVPDSTITQKQAELNSLYDSFSEKYGLINDRANRLAYADDSSESFCQGGAWIFFILLTQILSLLLPE